MSLKQAYLFRMIASSRVDTLLNVAIVVASLTLVIALVRAAYFARPNRGAKPIAAMTSGAKHTTSDSEKVTFEDVDWSKSKQTLLLFLSTTCGFCKKSAPFYKDISQEVTDARSLRLIAVFPQNQDLEKDKEFLNSAGIMISDIRQSRSNGPLGVTGTPTLVLVDKNGIATDRWVGALSLSQHSEILTRLGLRSGSDQ
jgi:thiol-disulfide isomerase/thioredoxin